MSEYSKEEALAFIEAISLTLKGKTGFRWMLEKLSFLSAYIDETATENAQLNAYIDRIGARADFESQRASDGPG